MNVNRYNRFIEKIMPNCVDNVDQTTMQLRTLSMFEYTGLPDTIPSDILELYLQTQGFAVFYEHDGNLYVYVAGLGGEPNVYHRPTIANIANPSQNLSVSAVIGKDCEVVRNDTLYRGLTEINDKYSNMLKTAYKTFEIALINMRIISLISAGNDKAKKEAELFIEQISKGNLAVVGGNNFFEMIKTLPYTTTGTGNYLTSVIEAIQYIRATWFNVLGLNANYNMKRESLNSDESLLNKDALKPLIDNMLYCRQTDLEKVNDMFGTDIQVELNSSWRDIFENTDVSLMTDTIAESEGSENGDNRNSER